MKKFVVKVVIFSLVVLLIVFGINLWIDPGNLFHTKVIDEMAELLNEGRIIETPGNIDEGLFLEKMVSMMDEAPDTVIVGSSHVMYHDWDRLYDDYYDAALSGAYMGDYFAAMGIFDNFDKMPKRVVFGVDPWAFESDITSGRHSSVRDYAGYMWDTVLEKENDYNVGSQKTTFKKVKGLFEFTYFQNSLLYLKSMGIKYYLSGRNEEVRTALDASEGERQKIVPSGKRIMNTGSYEPKDKVYNDAQFAIENDAMYELADGFSEPQYNNISQFEALVMYLQAENIEVVFFLHPWYPDVYDYFETAENYHAVLEIEDYLRNYATERNITVIGSYDPDICGVTAEDFADWLHVSGDVTFDVP